MGFINWLFGKSKYEKEQERLKQEQEEQREKRWEILEGKVNVILDRIGETRTDSKKTQEYRPYEPQEKAADKPWVSMVLSNEILTVVLKDGQVLTRYGADKDLNDKVVKCSTPEQIRGLMFPEVVEREEEKKRVAEEIEALQKGVNNSQQKDIDDNLKYLVESGEFEVVGDKAYVKGINVAMPSLMTYKFVELVKKIFSFQEDPSNEEICELEDEYQALKNFWMWCVNCPNPASRNDLFKFLKNHDMRINKNGLFFAYRRVDQVANNEEGAKIATYVSSEYLRVKKAKKGPRNFNLIKDENGIRAVKSDRIENGWEVLGNLAELYENLSESQGKTFTDNYSHTFDIRIGKEVSMPREKCDPNSNLACSTGLHIGNKSFGFSGFGGTHLLVLVNPMNAVSVPHSETNKMRVCAYYPVAVIQNEEEQTTFLEDANVLELGNEYFAEQIDKLENMAYSVESELEDRGIAQFTVDELAEPSVDIKGILAKRKKKA